MKRNKEFLNEDHLNENNENTENSNHKKIKISTEEVNPIWLPQDIWKTILEYFDLEFLLKFRLVNRYCKQLVDVYFENLCKQIELQIKYPTPYSAWTPKFFEMKKQLEAITPDVVNLVRSGELIYTKNNDGKVNEYFWAEDPRQLYPLSSDPGEFYQTILIGATYGPISLTKLQKMKINSYRLIQSIVAYFRKEITIDYQSEAYYCSIDGRSLSDQDEYMQQQMLEKINFQGPDHQTLLHFFGSLFDTSIPQTIQAISFLIDRGADINIEGLNQLAPVHIMAHSCKTLDDCRKLLQICSLLNVEIGCPTQNGTYPYSVSDIIFLKIFQKKEDLKDEFINELQKFYVSGYIDDDMLLVPTASKKDRIWLETFIKKTPSDLPQII